MKTHRTKTKTRRAAKPGGARENSIHNGSSPSAIRMAEPNGGGANGTHGNSSGG
jgi:hypothetical protein